MAHVCHFCGSHFSTNYNMQRHMRSRHGAGCLVPYTCYNCDKTFTRKEYLIEHMTIAHRSSDQDEMFVCAKCPKQFLSKRRLRRHEKTHANTEFYCDICQENGLSDMQVRSFKTKEYLDKHKRITHGKVVFECPHCGKTWKKRANMINHIKKNH
ncbi:unnamed protein product [Owenia fusiformis]|uniref:Uncharacterized protein n=1 Tax=Owenia fusiformis TaxID=6347 RepID=A0A8J1TX37_OWEFU|nr:unnamed protein product [Owenia fusiformis]